MRIVAVVFVCFLVYQVLRLLLSPPTGKARASARLASLDVEESPKIFTYNDIEFGPTHMDADSDR